MGERIFYFCLIGILFCCFQVIQSISVIKAKSNPLPRIISFIDNDGIGKFKNIQTNEVFVPRGVNYIRLSQVMPGGYHSTFGVSFNQDEYLGNFRQLKDNGYNIVRVFIDCGDVNREDGVGGNYYTSIGLNQTYLDRVAQFLIDCTDYGIYMIPVLNLIPITKYYLDMTLPQDPNLQGINAFYLHRPHFEAKKKYIADFITQLKLRVNSEYLTTIFSYELENELYYDGSLLPFSSSTIKITTADGVTYDMNAPNQRQQAADANTVLFANEMYDVALSLDPGCMVDIGMFTFQAVGKKGPTGLLPIPKGTMDPRFPVYPVILSRYSKLSFLDVHLYPVGADWTIDADLNTENWKLMNFSMPIILGEFGAFKFQFPDIVNGALAMEKLQIDSCHYHFNGWLFWTWDTWEQPELWNLVSDKGTINGVLAPIVRSNPCSK